MSPKKKTSPELPYLSQDTKVPNKSHIALSASRINCQKNFFFQTGTHTFSNSDRDFYSENNNVSQVYTYSYIPKIQKKKQR
jgi:hypothetical protein